MGGIKKIIGLMILNFFLLFSFSQATETVGNCSMSVIEGQEYHQIENRDARFGKLFPESAIIRVFDNLKSFCCNNSRYQVSQNICEKEKNNLQISYPETPFLYDHILDVMLRRLDAKQNDQLGGDLIYKIKPDEVGLEWRTTINDIANNKDGALPKTIETIYKENRELGNIDYKIPFRDKKGEYLGDLEEINNNYDDFNLINRYYYSCEIALLFYFKLGGTLNIGLDNNKMQSMTKAYDNCRDLVQKRIDQENSYVKALLIQKGNTLLQDAVKSYIDTYFIQNKLMNLQNTIFQTKNYFFDVHKNVNELIQSCS